jgi:hypothetical protein
MMWRIRVMLGFMAGWMDGWVWLVGMLEGWMFRMYVRVTRCLRLLQEEDGCGLWLWKGLSQVLRSFRRGLLPEIPERIHHDISPFRVVNLAAHL